MKKVLSSFIAVALILQLFAMVVTVLAEENALIPAEFEGFDLTQNITRAEFDDFVKTLKKKEKIKREEDDE